MKTIIAAFCDNASAQQGGELLKARLSSGNRDKGRIRMLAYQQGTNMLSTLRAQGVSDERAHLYAELIRRGAPVLIAEVPDSDARELANELDKIGSLDLEAAASRWRSSGWNGYDASSVPFDATACAAERHALRAESLPSTQQAASTQAARDTGETGDLDVIEEHVAIGKREVQRGGVRVRTFIVERPVDEDIQLREERIDVQRERVDEPISSAAGDANFTEDEFVVTARGEEAVVGKEARVVERVHVGKREDVRTETIHETERKRDVEVEPIETTTTPPDEPRSRGPRR